MLKGLANTVHLITLVMLAILVCEVHVCVYLFRRGADEGGTGVFRCFDALKWSDEFGAPQRTEGMQNAVPQGRSCAQQIGRR